MRILTILSTLGLAAVLLASCRSNAVASAPAATPAATAAPAATAETTTAAKTVVPVPATTNMEALDDCTFAASFPASALEVAADGTKVLSVTVYDCDKFDLVDIAQLAPGDTIVIEGQDIAVTAAEHGDNRVIINGGTEQGGWELTCEEDGVYKPTILDAGPLYHVLGEASLPLAEDFVYTDRSDLEKPEVQYTVDEFADALNGGDTEFNASVTTVTVEGGKIIALTRIYMP